MTTLGSYPSRRYSRAWITQRLFNRIPSWAQARKSAVSIGQQLLNPIALEIQDSYQQLAKARYDQFLSTADIGQLEFLYRCDLLPEMEFTYVENIDGEKIYTPPSVYGTIDGVEYKLTQAEENNIQTLAYDNLPSRIQNADLSYLYEEVIPETTITNLSSVSPNAFYVYGHLYITIKNNSNWEERTNKKVYYPKVYITGITRKGTTTTEAIPIRYNGTFKTINEWKEVTSVFVSYLSSTATITIELFPFGRESFLDTQNICVTPDDGEKLQFTKLATKSFGTSFQTEAFVLSNMDIIRQGLDDKGYHYEIELLDQSSNNITLSDYIHRPHSRYVYGIDANNFYVYDINLPFPDVLNLSGETEDARIDLYSDQWVLSRGDTVTIKTNNGDILNVPWRVRWHVLDPDDNEYYMGQDGSFWPTTTDAWIENLKIEDTIWDEQTIEFTVSKAGRYIISLEAEYYDETSNISTVRTSKFLFFLPVITPEVQFTLPTALKNATNITIDSDNNVWLLKSGSVYQLDILFDYYLVDYERSRVYTKENYSSVRIVI